MEKTANCWRQAGSQAGRQVELLMASEPAGESLPELLTDGFIVAGAGGDITYANRAARALFRRLHGEGDIEEARLGEVCADPAVEKALVEDNTWVEREVKVQGLVLLVRAVPLFKWGQVSGYAMVVRDVTEARGIEEELAAKSAAIQEIHHRIKNDLQIVAGLLRLQQRRVHSAAMKGVLADSIDRILAVAAVHEILSSGGSGLVDVREVAEKIVTMQQTTQREPGRNIEIRVSGDRIMLAGKRAMSAGLVINELTHNAFSHAFSARAEGRIEVALEDKGQSVVLRVSDNGTGFPEGFFAKKSPTLGLSIVRALVADDLKGVIEISNRNGAYIEVEFPKQAEREGVLRCGETKGRRRG
ncbi:MAG: sensor histidine kinase [Ignavibacteriales bacterium]